MQLATAVLVVLVTSVARWSAARIKGGEQVHILLRQLAEAAGQNEERRQLLSSNPGVGFLPRD